jgi:hypothetical protein
LRPAGGDQRAQLPAQEPARRRDHRGQRHRLTQPDTATQRHEHHGHRPKTRSDHDTVGLIDHALAELAERRGAWLGDHLTAVTLIASLIDQAQRCLPELVTNARLNQHAWEQIAHALGTSPNEARLRFDPESPIADTRWPYH